MYLVNGSKVISCFENHLNQRWYTHQSTDTDTRHSMHNKWIVFQTKFKNSTTKYMYVKFNSKYYSQICISEHFKTKKNWWKKTIKMIGYYSKFKNQVIFCSSMLRWWSTINENSHHEKVSQLNCLDSGQTAFNRSC